MRAGGSSEVTLLAPASAASLSPGPIRFVWRPVAGSPQYTLEVDASDGTVLFSRSTRDTTLVAELGAVARGEHAWLVRARLDDGSERRSDLRVLRLQ
jgi:hypothetical protein